MSFYSHTSSISGAEVVLLSVLDGLDRTRYEPLLIAPCGELANSAVRLNVKHLPFDELHARFTKNPFRLARYVFQAAIHIFELRALLKRRRPALLHANSIRAGMIASMAATGLNLRVIWHLHDILPDNAPGLAIRKLANSLSRTAYLAVSNATAAGFAFCREHHVVTRKIEVIYNSVDSKRFCPDADARLAIRQELGLTDDDVAVGAIAQITPRKRQLELLEVFAEDHAKVPNAILFFVGGGLFNLKNRQYEARLKARIDELRLGDRVRFLGKRSDIPSILNGLDIVVQNSDREPLGMAILEAMATAKPVISTSVDGTPEVIADGEDGFLVALDEPTQLMQRVKSLHDDPDMRRTFGMRGRAKVLTKFSPGEQASRLDSYYHALLAD
ncbi:glycosyltransferase family 4 protein [Terriglobus roseus]|uniref:glycosyltransferase family 4 protein n=1 Tax=Terriglobus roseus TaxID=392734 RepID=UPI001FCD5E62|nr:glycosyltransferase family 4 protein [Terriglobus roseus]